MSGLNNYIETSVNALVKVKSDELLIESWEKARDLIVETVKNRRMLFMAGNGGSAADAQHFASELTGRFKKERPSSPAIALTTDTSAITAIGNDYGFTEIFSRQLEGLGKKGDVFIAISTSGNSKNLIYSCIVAKQKGMTTIALLGKDGGLLKDIADISMVVPIDATSHIQEIHQQMYHCWCEAVDEIYDK